MKLCFKYIAALFLMFAASGCSIDEFGPDSATKPSSDVVTVIGRVASFEDRDVATRGVKDDAEKTLNSMALAIFPVKSDGSGFEGDGGCVYYQYSDNQTQLMFSIERGSTYTKNARYAMYVFTNMPGMGQFEAGATLEELLKVANKVEQNLNIPQNGFPMMGSLGDTFSTTFDKDDQKFVLAPADTDGNLLTPTVDDISKDILYIPMKAMYAKVNFTIEVRPDQTLEGGFTPQFELSNYKVYNLPKYIDFHNQTNSDTDVVTEDGLTREVTGYTIARGANKINFSFYVPERLLTPATLSHDGSKDGQAGYYDYSFPVFDGKYRNEDLAYRQRYKSELLGDGQKATNIQISGKFRDHQNHSWDVTYTIYLGEDNYGDFNIRRNYEYNNYITIRGIQSSNDSSADEGSIIDHRVDVHRTQPAIISLRRETLLDSHFEVRPLRVRSSDVDYSESGINAVKIEIVDPDVTKWMRLERSFGDGTPGGSPQTTVNGKPTSIYIDSDPGSASYGKRKFFTYNLIDGVGANATDASLVNSTSVILPLTATDECCWIYVDECTESGDGSRSGIVRVSYGSLNGTTFTPANSSTYPDVDYVISQRKLFNVKYDDPETATDENRQYYIEYSEEYLYNFDADDQYGQTVYEGMKWGLEGVQLSYDHPALFFTSILGLDFISGIINSLKGDTPAYYDFYIKSHDADYVDEEQATLHEYAGYDFCNEIIQTVNGGQKDSEGHTYDTDPNNDINILQLDQQPQSAIEYCYNKNKRNNKGQVVWQNDDNSYNISELNWYLPAVDQIEDIVMSKYGDGLYTYARFIEFQEQDYWSCQPAYLKNYARYDQWYVLWTQQYYGDFFIDDIGNAKFDIESNSDRKDVGSARSTSVTFNEGYTSTPSGTKGYYYYYNANDKTSSYSGNYNGKEMNTVSREPGNQPRDERNRVRCVRLAPNQTN